MYNNAFSKKRVNFGYSNRDALKWNSMFTLLVFV